MTPHRVASIGNILEIDGERYTLDRPIGRAFAVGDLVIVMFDLDSYLSKPGQFHNVVAFQLDGSPAWEAELPTSTPADCYYDVTLVEGALIARSFMSFDCTIDPATGRIISQEFTK